MLLYSWHVASIRCLYGSNVPTPSLLIWAYEPAFSLNLIGIASLVSYGIPPWNLYYIEPAWPSAYWVK